MWRRSLVTIYKGSMYALVLALLAGAGGMLLLRVQSKQILSVQSGSMSPAIHRGDAVVIQLDPSTLKIGDVVSFVSREHNGVIVSHRITAVDPTNMRFVTKGDASARPDKPILRTDIIGKIERVMSDAGFVLNAFRHPLGLVALVYVPTLCIVVGEVQRLSRHYARTPGRRYHLYGYPN